MNKNIIAFILVVIGLIGLMWWGRNNQAVVSQVSQDGEKSSLVAEETLYDFGTISMKNGNVTKDFTVTNPTDKDIFVPSLVTSCMCTKAFMVLPDGTIKGPFGMPSMGFVPPVNEIIKPGEKRTVRAVYDPNAHGPAGVGPIDRFIILTDKSGSTLQFEIKALVTP